MSFLLCLLFSQFFEASYVIDLTTKSFKRNVLGTDDTYFISFSFASFSFFFYFLLFSVLVFTMTNCPACHQMMPEFERLAEDLHKLGIKAGRANINQNPELANAYQCRMLPKLMLFRPNRDPIEYQSERSAEAMGKFTQQHQLGSKQVAVLNSDERMDKFFNESSKVPRLLMVSKRLKPSPLFKQLCYKNRRGIVCGFVSDQHLTIHRALEEINHLGNLTEKDFDIPAVFTIDRERDPVLKAYEGKLEYDPVNKFVLDVSVEEKLKRLEEEEKAAAKTSKKSKSAETSSEL